MARIQLNPQKSHLDGSCPFGKAVKMMFSMNAGGKIVDGCALSPLKVFDGIDRTVSKCTAKKKAKHAYLGTKLWKFRAQHIPT